MPLQATLGEQRPPTTVYFWDGITLTEATTSDAVSCAGYRDKILTFVSDTGGTLTIETDPFGDEDWDTYDTVTVTANTRENYIFPTGMQHDQVRIAFSVAAVVTGSLAMA